MGVRHTGIFFEKKNENRTFTLYIIFYYQKKFIRIFLNYTNFYIYHEVREKELKLLI